jgi:hydrogenase expression/formation protein HypE
MGHGGGGKLSAELVEHLFVPAFRNDPLDQLSDSAVLPPIPGRIAVSTDSFVVRPLVFPGGSIGELAVNGTVNDLAMNGARPLYLTAGFILEEGLSVALLGEIVERMAAAARRAGVTIVTGDIKVVERGHGDGCYINTAGVGAIPDGIALGPSRAQVGDAVILSGTIGDHGVAVMSVREGLEFETTIESDCQPLHELGKIILEEAPLVRVMRDPTRGGVASALNEIAARSGVGMELDESAIPVRPEVRGACEVLGLDPIYVANEGKLLAIVAAEAAARIVERMHTHPAGRDAAIIGRVTGAAPLVVARTAIGGTRVIPMQVGEQLPRIC